ncbi:protein PEAK3 [Egretta garzetta]|uniref:protein PEAK3 n=1 Tax=Egretta garzetta TaxID=188379 RepID=UPI00163CF995|nr:protein PEAK3 [Egretta garzetta]
MAGAGRAWDREQEPPSSQGMELEPPRPPPLPGKTQRGVVQARGSVYTRSGSLDLGAPGPPAPMLATPGGCSPRPPDSALIYSNVGELRAHLVPRKASRGEGAGRPPSQSDQDPLPPPLPKKQLQRAESFPEQGLFRHGQDNPTPWAGSILYTIPPPHPRHEEGAPSSIPPWDRPSWGSKKPLTKSQSLGEPVAWSNPQKVPSPSPAELTFRTVDGELGQLLQPLESLDGVGRVVLGCQAASILDRAPCCESGDAWYFRVGFTFEQTQLVLAAKVPKRGCASLGVQSPFGAHCSIQRLIGRFTDLLPQELVLPGRLGEHSRSPSGKEPARLATHPVLQVFISPEVPYQTLAGFVKGSHSLHRTSPGHYERLACLLLLQVCMGLEHLRVQNVGQGDLCPENLLLVRCPCLPRSQQGKEASLCLPRLLISSFFKVKDKRRSCSTSQEQDWRQGLATPPSPVADELNVGMLIYQILHVDISLENALGFRSNRLPEIPSLSIYSTGLKRLAMLLLHRDPCKRVSIEQARSILQVLLWGPRQELFARSRKTLALLQSWVEVKRALLLLKFAENSARAGARPSLAEGLGKTASTSRTSRNTRSTRSRRLSTLPKGKADAQPAQKVSPKPRAPGDLAKATSCHLLQGTQAGPGWENSVCKPKPTSPTAHE